ncbi:MAG TPA: hypothetical protein VGB55_14785, partial [Tepidisphaeraceae bacterium]
MIIARRGQFDSTVTVNRTLCREHFLLTLRMPSFPPSRPGQFVQVACNDDDVVQDAPREWPEDAPPELSRLGVADRVAILRRPFSLAGRREVHGGVEIDLIGRDIGVGTRWLSQLSVGDNVNLLGPLGNGFTLPGAGGLALMVGGGVGIPPMIYLSQIIAAENAQRESRGEKPARAVVFCGAMTLDLLALTITNDAPRPGIESIDPLYNIAEFSQYNVPAVISTDDGTYGFKGRVTGTLTRYLDQWITDNADRNLTILYTCGPEPMMKAVADLAMRRQL